MTHVPAPPPLQAPTGDTTRYVAWLDKHGKSTAGAREAVDLRIADWGFFETAPVPGGAHDRVALDNADHAVQPREQGAWHLLLSAKGLDAIGAHKRVAWLFRAIEVMPGGTARVSEPQKITAPSLKTNADGSVTFQGFLAYPPNVSRAMRITIVASPGGAKITNEPATRL